MENDGYRLSRSGKEALTLPGCYATITRARASLGTRGRAHVDNEDQGKLVGSQQQGTENTQVLEHNSNWWGSGGRT